VGKPEGNRPFGRPALRREDNIRVDHEDLGWECVGYIGLAQNRESWRTLVNAQTNLMVSQNVRTFLTNLEVCSKELLGYNEQYLGCRKFSYHAEERKV